MRRVLGLAVLLVLLAAGPATGAARSYQIDAEHSERVPAGGPAPPLARIWERRIGGRLSYQVPLLLGRHVWAVKHDGVLVAHELQSGRRVFARRLIPEGAWVSVGASLSAAGGMLIVPARDRVLAFRGAGGR
jgi:hypothetical protein